MGEYAGDGEWLIWPGGVAGGNGSVLAGVRSGLGGGAAGSRLCSSCKVKSTTVDLGGKGRFMFAGKFAGRPPRKWNTTFWCSVVGVAGTFEVAEADWEPVSKGSNRKKGSGSPLGADRRTVPKPGGYDNCEVALEVGVVRTAISEAVWGPVPKCG